MHVSSIVSSKDSHIGHRFSNGEIITQSGCPYLLHAL